MSTPSSGAAAAADAPPLRSPRRGDASAQRGAVVPRLPASDRADQRRFQRASSVRVPWAVGLLLFSVIAVAIPLYTGGDATPGDVPPVLLSQQEAVTRHGAQAIRRSVNEGVADLVELALSIEVLGPGAAEREQRLLTGFNQVHRRYTAVYTVSPSKAVVSAVGARPRPDLLPGGDAFREPDMQDAVREDDALLVLQHAPVRRCPVPARPTVGPIAPCAQVGAVVGHYEPAFLLNPIGGLELGRAWVVNAKGQVLATPGVAGSLQALPREDLREAAARASAGEHGAYAQSVSGGRTELVAFAPVNGFGPSGSLGWSVVTARPLDQLDRTDDDRSRQALLLAAITALATAVVFGWLWLAVLRPLDHLEQEADRLAYGDLDAPVEVGRQDEIGLVAKSLERLRVALLRGTRPGDRPSGGPQAS